jgi:SAM-dependent methyltransferase
MGNRIGSPASPTIDSLLPLLRCPASGEELILDDGWLTTNNGYPRYPVVAGVPFLICKERSLFDPQPPTGDRPAHTRRRLGRTLQVAVQRVAKARPTISANVAAHDNYRELLRLLTPEDGSEHGRKRVLVIGSGSAAVGMEALIESPAIDVVETDVVAGPRIRVVCDGHDLPFAAGSYDAVVCQAVLSHVVDPERVVGEIHRVLADGGLVYSETSFLQQVCEEGHDFTRWTHLGHRRLFRCFDELRSGAQCGPGMSLAWAIRGFALAFLGRSWLARAAVDRLVSLSTFWLKYLDPFLVERPGGIDAASGTFFLGRRREHPVPDCEIIAGFRGV